MLFCDSAFVVAAYVTMRLTSQTLFTKPFYIPMGEY
jgi:hypothetical protein